MGPSRWIDTVDGPAVFLGGTDLSEPRLTGAVNPFATGKDAARMAVRRTQAGEMPPEGRAAGDPGMKALAFEG